jgi:hypothetical protein
MDMKLRLLYETDLDLRKLGRRYGESGTEEDRQALWTAQQRAGFRGDWRMPIPPGFERNPSRILRLHKELFGGQRWLAFEEAILNFRKTKSFELGRVGDMTFPTQVAARYAMQLDEPWPEFIPLAEHMLEFLFNPDRTSNSNHATPLRAHRIRPVIMMIAKYLVKFQINPPWAKALYDRLYKSLERILTPLRYYSSIETGEIRSHLDLAPDGPQDNPDEWEPYEDDMWLWSHLQPENKSENVTTLSRILPDLKKLVGA